MKNDKSKKVPATSAKTATAWAEIPRPQTYREAVSVAERLIAARLKDDPKARWRICINQTEEGPHKIFLKTDMEGTSRAEFFGRIASGDIDLSISDQAMAARLQREQGYPSKGKGRPTRERSALMNPAGQSLDVIIFQTCMMLARLGWTPLSRAEETGLRLSIFDAVAEAISAIQPRCVSYSGIRDAYYRVSE